MVFFEKERENNFYAKSLVYHWHVNGVRAYPGRRGRAPRGEIGCNGEERRHKRFTGQLRALTLEYVYLLREPLERKRHTRWILRLPSG